jgi:hypothetical protein
VRRLIVRDPGQIPGRRLPRDVTGSPVITDIVHERLSQVRPVLTKQGTTEGMGLEPGKEQSLQRLALDSLSFPEEAQARAFLMTAALYDLLPDPFLRAVFLRRVASFRKLALSKARVFVRCDDPLMKAPPILVSSEMQKQQAQARTAALADAGIKTPTQEAHEAEAKDDDKVEKGGEEGSRGGHVIGHTSSGKPIYGASHAHAAIGGSKKQSDTKRVAAFIEAHPGWTEHDHQDAKKVHGAGNEPHSPLASMLHERAALVMKTPKEQPLRKSEEDMPFEGEKDESGTEILNNFNDRKTTPDEDGDEDESMRSAIADAILDDEADFIRSMNSVGDGVEHEGSYWTADTPEELHKSFGGSGFIVEDDLIKAAGPYIGPHGGKWADPEHKIPWQEKKHSGKAAPKAKDHDEHAAENLHLISENNAKKLSTTRDFISAGPEEQGEHHLAQQKEAIHKNLANKMASGTYDHAQATKLWAYHAKAVDAHAKKHGLGGGASPSTRMAAAKKMADQFVGQAKSGEHDDKLNKKNAKALDKHKASNPNNDGSAKDSPSMGSAYTLGKVGGNTAPGAARSEGDSLKAHGLSDAANKQSSKAEASGNASEHKAAAQAHLAAADAHGSNGYATKHKAKAEEHTGRAASLSGGSGGGASAHDHSGHLDAAIAGHEAVRKDSDKHPARGAGDKTLNARVKAQKAFGDAHKGKPNALIGKTSSGKPIANGTDYSSYAPGEQKEAMERHQEAFSALRGGDPGRSSGTYHFGDEAKAHEATISHLQGRGPNPIKKSLSGELEDWLAKAGGDDEVPKSPGKQPGIPSPTNGGPVDGVSGTNPTQGPMGGEGPGVSKDYAKTVHLTDAQGVRKDFESLDEGDKPGIREDNSDMPKGARMEKSNADRTFAERRMAAEQQEVVSTRPIRKAIVHYSGSADAAVEAMMKGRTRGILDIASHGVAGSPLQKSTTCSSCGRAHAAFMTVCPTCGTGQMEERSSGNVIVKSAPSLPGLPAGFVTPFRRVTITGGE